MAEREMGAETLHVGDREYGVSVVDDVETGTRYVSFHVGDACGRNDEVVYEHTEAIPKVEAEE